MWGTTTAPRSVSATDSWLRFGSLWPFSKRTPWRPPVLSGEIRGKPLGRFRHTLLYTLETNEVVILAVAHQRQDLETWLEIVLTRREGA